MRMTRKDDRKVVKDQAVSCSFETDLVVLGAGPAGSAAAITARSHGLRVAILEREPFPRLAPGESVHPGIQPLLRTLGVESDVLAHGFPRYLGHRVRWGGRDEFATFGQDESGPWLGFQLWRPTFDQILLDRARMLGVEVLQPWQARGMARDRDGMVVVAADEGTVRARIVVDATGRWRALSRWLSLAWTRRGAERRVWYGYVAGARGGDADYVPALTGDRTGWTWVACVKPGTFQWTRMNLDGCRPQDDWRPSELAGFEPLGPVCGADATWQSADAPAGPGYFLTGDAAAVLDPCSSHGVLKALMSGMYAGDLTAHQCRGRIDSVAAAERYSTWLHGWHRADVEQLEAFYSELETT